MGANEVYRLVAHDRDVPLAGRRVFHPNYIAGAELSRLTIGRGHREDARQDHDELSRGSRMVKSILQIMSTPKSDPVSLDTVWTTMTAAKEAGHARQAAEGHSSW